MPETFTAADAGDLRFQFEVIKNLAESVRQQVSSVERLTSTVADVQKTQVSMLERLARIEANRINEDVARLQTITDLHNGRIDELESAEDRRRGGASTRRAVISYWSIIATVVGVFGTVFYLLFRATGIIHLPADNPLIIQQAPAPSLPAVTKP